MRMLLVVDLFPFASLTAREQVGVAATTNRPRLSAEHAAKLQATGSRVPLSHAHDPVDASKLVIAALAGVMKKLEKRVLMRHELPGTALPVNGVHRRCIRQPGGAGSVTGHLHVMTLRLRCRR